MTITDIDKQDWKYELIRDFTSPGHAHVHSFRQMNLNHEEIGKLIKFIEKVYSQAKAEQREEDARIAESKRESAHYYEASTVANINACNSIAQAIRGAK